jgi:hypothetical protein
MSKPNTSQWSRTIVSERRSCQPIGLTDQQSTLKVVEIPTDSADFMPCNKSSAAWGTPVAPPRSRNVSP